MRASLVGLVAATALVLTALPGAAVAATRVDGKHLAASGVRVARQGCVDPTLEPRKAATLRLVRDHRAPLGSGAIGWTSRVTSYLTGPLVHVKHPAALSRLSIAVRRHGEALSGQALARYSAPGDDGQWRGSAVLPGLDRSGWHVVRGEALAFRWRHYAADGTPGLFGPTTTISDFAASQGGDGGGAWVGFGFGCSGDKFDVDALTFSAGRESKKYDFGQYLAHARLTRADGGAKALTVVAGASPVLRAALLDSRGKALGGTLKLQRKELGHKKFRTVEKVPAGSRAAHRLVVKPLRSSIYRVRYAGTSTRAPDTSTTVKVLVRSNVRGHLVSGSVVRGRSFTIAGKFYPGRSAKVALQRYSRGEWTTVKRLRTAKDGSYRVTRPSTRIGKSYWRILVPQGGGNLRGHSATMRLVTKPRPKNGGGGGSTPTNPTPPPVDPPQPPPPPTGPQ